MERTQLLQLAGPASSSRRERPQVGGGRGEGPEGREGQGGDQAPGSAVRTLARDERSATHPAERIPTKHAQPQLSLPPQITNQDPGIRRTQGAAQARVLSDNQTRAPWLERAVKGVCSLPALSTEVFSSSPRKSQ